MPAKKPTSIYRSLLRDAFRVTRERRNLWVFGLFAALLSTGGVGEMAAKGWHRLSVARDVYGEIVRGTFTGTRTFGTVVRTCLSIAPSQATAMMTMMILVAFFAVAVSVVSQGVVLSAVGPKPVTDPQAVTAGKKSFWHLLALNVLNKAAHAILIALSSLPFLLILEAPRGSSALIAFATFLVAFPLTVVIAALFMIASVHISKTNAHSLDAIHHAVLIFKKHWLAAFELGLILFLCVIAASGAFVMAVSILSIPFVLAVSVAVISSSATAFLVANVLGAFVLLLLVFAFAGATTTFQYAAWVKFYALATGPIKKTISKTHRVWRGK
ncbi:MAG: hypothetical protein WCO25_06070 [Candidatus Uhrbacteria bacterium]